MQCHKGTSGAGCPSRAWTPVPPFPEVEPLWHRVPSSEQLLLYPGFHFGAEFRRGCASFLWRGSRFQSSVLSHTSLGLCWPRVWVLHVFCRFCWQTVSSLRNEQSAHLLVTHFSHLVASVELCPEWTVLCSQEWDCLLSPELHCPQVKLAVLAALKGLF